MLLMTVNLQLFQPMMLNLPPTTIFNHSILWLPLTMQPARLTSFPKYEIYPPTRSQWQKPKDRTIWTGWVGKEL